MFTTKKIYPNNNFEVAKRSIANAQFCEAYLLSVIYNLKMTINFSRQTVKNLETLNNFVVLESNRQKKIKLELEDTQNGITGGSAFSQEQTDTNENLSGGKIIEIQSFIEKIETNPKNFETIDLLSETISLLKIAFGYISSNQEVALKEAQDALLCVEAVLVVGVPLETKLTEFQFTFNPFTIDSSLIKTYNTTISNLPPILTKLNSVTTTLIEDITDTNELVDQVRTIVFSRSTQNESAIVSVLKWFTSQTNNKVRTEMILNALESVFSSMDLVVHYSSNASTNLKAIINKVKIYKISGILTLENE